MRIFHPIMTLILAAAVAGCASSKQSTEIEQSGFLADYSALARGEEGEAAFRYRNPDADWAAYDKIMFDPITVWRTPNAGNLPVEDLQMLANNLYGLIYQELEKDYTMVSDPQDEAIRIQIAFTGAERSNATLDVVSTVLPIGWVASSATEFVTGEPAFGGGATIEAKITDAATGEILAAAIDKRVGGRDLEGAFDTWDDVNSALVHWSQMARFRMCVLRDGTDCVEPG